ncbi:CMRF35-like molecule 7 [Clarias gariepinus]|uniref:CMRF35-like molecule 7 n=1 Tax=Clarias gariepinus TaxID=13013 RepID=UPI00234C4D26|nr:CMRF35-like molecule 7 [Clarias gariepinus]
MEMVLIFTFCLILAGTDAVTTVTGYRGRSVQIKCNYTTGYEKNNKFLCRGKCPYVGYRDVPVQSGSPAKDSRFSLYDDTTAKVFTVTITDLRPEDEGTYWCGIDQIGRDIYTEILLLVKPENLTSSTVSHTTHTTFTTHITHTNSTHSMSPSVHAENTHSTTDNPLNDANHPNSTSSSQGFPTSTLIITVSVVLVLILFALILTVTLQRKKKTRGSETMTESPKETNEDYENDQNVRPVKERENVTSSVSVYQSLNPTTNQSDSVYQTLTVSSND